ncbi:MAG: YgaP family membrane protein [Gaiellaceae bacterium]
MSRNMNTTDQALRAFLVAPAAIVGAFVVGAGSIAGILLFALAAIMLATSAVGFCPLYKLLHLNTRGRTPLPH